MPMCHGYSRDATAAVIDQIERFAPGFRERIVGINVRTPRGLQEHDANLVGGDVNGGSMDLRQFIARPRRTTDPYWTGVPGHFLCSASTPPAAGLHGMWGTWSRSRRWGACAGSSSVVSQ
jgi:phytoene dehydrogenase-like protein